MSKSSCKTVKLEASQLDKNHTLIKEKLKSLSERLHGLLRLSGMGSTIKLSFVTSGSLRAEKRSCVNKTWQVSLEHSNFTDHKGNSML